MGMTREAMQPFGIVIRGGDGPPSRGEAHNLVGVSRVRQESLLRRMRLLEGDRYT